LKAPSLPGFALALALAAPPHLLQAAAPDSKVTVLDPVFVEASPVATGHSGIPWQYFSVPGFEVISRCPAAFNEAYARALGRSTAARRALLPEYFWGVLPTPIKIILYDRIPEERDGPVQLNPIDLTWSPEDGAILGSDSMQLSHPVTLGDGDTFINCGNYWDVKAGQGDFSVDVDSAILIETRVPHFPAWFVAGLEGPRGLYAHRFTQATPQGDFLVLPNALWTTTAETIAIQNEAREKHKDGYKPRVRTLLPLGDLFAGGAPPDRRDLWNAEAALFVRWGLYGSGERQAFLNLVGEATREPVTEAVFRRNLGLGYAEAQQRLGDYLAEAASEPIRVPIAAASNEPLEVRDATSTEVARIVGDWGRLEGRSEGGLQFDYQRECLEQADRLFERIVARRERDPLFLAAFGLYEIQVGDFGRALGALDAATKAGVVRPRAYVELARLLLKNALPGSQAGIGDLDAADFAEIVGLLTTARTQMPALLSSYQVLARALEHAPSRPTLEELAPLGSAVRLFPQNATLANKVATLYRRLGYPDEAAAIVRRALGLAETDDERTLLAAFPLEKAR
jgi:tetratricopeptide (TPR) repeat protein